MTIQNYNIPLLEAAKQKLPEGTNPATFLMKLLCIGKVAAYRRLRGEVPLTLEEAVRIARALEISIDRIVGFGGKKVSAFQMCMATFENPSQTDYWMLESYVELIRSAANDPLSRLSLSANTFPQQVYLQYENLTRFFLFQKAYHERGTQGRKYNQIFIPLHMRQVFRESFEAYRQFKTIHFVFDRYILLHLIRSITYFYDIGLISKQDVNLVREDILQMISYLEKVAANGRYDNGMQVYLYLSSINLDKNCHNMKIHDQHISIMEAYIFNGMASFVKEEYDRMEEWILSLCRLSTMISLCGESERIAFFNEQRRLLNTLSSEK